MTRLEALEKVAHLADLLWREASKVERGDESYYETSPRLMELMADALAALSAVPPREAGVKPETLCECGHPASQHMLLDRSTLPPDWRGPWGTCGPAGENACLCGKFRPLPAPPASKEKP